MALEGALKLKEISYIHAEGYPAAEMKHGPIALIDEEMPVVVIAPRRGNYDKILSNIQEVKARKGRIISVITEGDTDVKALSDWYFEIPDTAGLPHRDRQGTRCGSASQSRQERYGRITTEALPGRYTGYRRRSRKCSC